MARWKRDCIVRGVPTFQVNLPDVYFTKLKAEGGFAFLTSLPVNGKPKIVEIKVSLLESKEFIYSAARVKKSASKRENAPPKVRPR